MVAHADVAGHLPNWGRSSILAQGMDKRTSKLTEAAFIQTTSITHHRRRDVVWASQTAELMITSLQPPEPRHGDSLERHTTGEPAILSPTRSNTQVNQWREGTTPRTITAANHTAARSRSWRSFPSRRSRRSPATGST